MNKQISKKILIPTILAKELNREDQLNFETEKLTASRKKLERITGNLARAITEAEAEEWKKMQNHL